MKGGYMIKNKRGLSAIITTLLVVVLVLVAVGIVWGVISGVLTQGAENIEISARCLNVGISATAVNCADVSACVIILDRTGTETDAIEGVKLVFRDSTALENSAVIEEVGNIEKLVGAILTEDSTLTAPDSLEVTPYFLDASGNEQLCSTTTKDF
jgi:flagellin-like protein